MKILHVITGLGNGGAEAVLYGLISAEEDGINGHHVISLTDRGVFAQPLEDAGVAVSTLNMPRGRVTFGGLLKLYRLVRLFQPDVVQTSMYHANLVGGIMARLAGVRAITWSIHHANLDPAHNSRATLFVVKMCAFLSSWLPVKIVSCSVRATQLHRECGYSHSKFINIPNGYALDKFKPDSDARRTLRGQLDIPGNAFVIGMVARFDPQKDHDNLIDALSRLKRSSQELICLLVGSGMENGNSPLLARLESAGLTESVRLLGVRNDISTVMNVLDVHVLSSLGEAFPNVLAEAMACGTPCVSTDVGDASLIIGENGWIVPPRNSEALADGLSAAKSLFDNEPQTWRKLQIACRAHIVENFSLNEMSKRYRRVWKICATESAS